MSRPSPCPEGHHWQPLPDAQDGLNRRVYCSVCGLIQESLRAPDTVPERLTDQPTHHVTHDLSRAGAADKGAEPSDVPTVAARTDGVATGAAPSQGDQPPTVATLPPGFDAPEDRATTLEFRPAPEAQAEPDTVTPPGTKPGPDHPQGDTVETRLDTGSVPRRVPAAKAVQVPGYEILGELGRGGMGVVYKARHLKLKRLVALKMILAGAHASDEILARFRSEAEAVAQFQHPNIVQVYEVGEHEGRPFFSLEFVDGGSLFNWLDGPVPPEEAARLVEVLARAMQHAHQRGVVHRDLKPANILLASSREPEAGLPAAPASGSRLNDYTPKITDFGLAKRLEGDAGQTRSGAIMGTPSYMAPEQAEGRAKEVGPLADVYALGAILYELLAGRPPFQGESMMTTLGQVLHQEPPPPSRFQPRLPRDLETICLKCLAKDPRQRYCSALALAQDLERFLNGEPILGRRQGVLGKLWRKVKRSPALVAAAAVVLVAVAAAGVVTWKAGAAQHVATLQQEIEVGLDAADWPLAHRDALESRIQQLERLSPARGDAARQRLHQRFAAYLGEALRRPRLSPQEAAQAEEDLKWLAARDPDAVPALQQVLRQRLSSWLTAFELKAPFQELKQVFDPQRWRADGDVLRPADRVEKTPAPRTDGTLLTEVPCQGNVQIEAVFEDWESATSLGLLLNATQGHQREVAALAFAPDGQWLASAGHDGTVRLWDAATGQELLVARVPYGAVYSVAFSPDGRTLAAGDHQAVRLWDAVRGEELARLGPTADRVAALAFSPDGSLLAGGGGDGSLRLWDVAGRKELAVLLGHTGPVARVAFSADGTALVTAGTDRSVRRWDVAAREARGEFESIPKGTANGAVVVAPDGRTFAAARRNGVRLCDAATGRDVGELAWPNTGLSLLAFSPDGRHLAAGAGPKVRVWDVAGRKDRLTFVVGQVSYTSALAFSPDGSTLAVALPSGAVKLWDLAGGDVRLILGGQNYTFRLSAPEGPAADQPAGAWPAPATFADARAAGGEARLQIFRSGVRLREQVLPLPRGPLRLSASREGDQLQVRVNGQLALTFHDLLPISRSQPGVFGVALPAGAALSRLWAACQPLPEAVSPLEQGDELYHRGQYGEALSFYEAQALRSGDTSAGREARCKAGLCLVRLHRLDEAGRLFEQLAAQPGERWPLVAACQLWLLRLRQDRLDEAEGLLDSISSRFKVEELLALVSDDVRQRILQAHYIPGGDYLFFNPKVLRQVELVVALADYFQAPQERLWAQYRLVRLYSMAGQEDRAVETARAVFEQAARSPARNLSTLALTAEQYAWALQSNGRGREALQEIDRCLAEGPPAGAKTDEQLAVFRGLLVERARLHAALDDWARAEADLDDYLGRVPAAQRHYDTHSRALLLKGLARDRAGDAAGALAAWRQARYPAWRAQLSEQARELAEAVPVNQGVIYSLMAGSLSGELTDAEAESHLARLLDAVGGDTVPTQVAGLVRFPPAVFRDMWRTPRGRDCARKLALRTVSFTEYFRLPIYLTAAEMVRQGALPGAWSPEQDALIWRTIEDTFQAYTGGKLSRAQVLQVGLTWKGTANFLGWGGLAPTLSPALRGPLAYVFGHRYLRLQKEADAARFFRTARADAPPDSPLQRLAQAELDRLPDR